MRDLFFVAFLGAFFLTGLRRPFLLIAVYAYIDIVAPQKVSWGFLTHIPISLIAFSCALLGWIVAEDKNGIRISPRQFVLLMLASSVTSQISAEELTAVANYVQSDTYRAFETYILIALAYIALSLVLRAAFWGLGQILFPRRRRLGTPL